MNLLAATLKSLDWHKILASIERATKVYFYFSSLPLSVLIELFSIFNVN